MHHPTDRIAHTTAFVTPVEENWLEREIAQWVHPMKDRSDDPSHHERTLLPRSYISLPVSRETATLNIGVVKANLQTVEVNGIVYDSDSVACSQKNEHILSARGNFL